MFPEENVIELTVRIKQLKPDRNCSAQDTIGENLVLQYGY
jgi:hypothetical protein